MKQLKTKPMETALTFLINNIVIITLIAVFTSALVYEGASKIKKVFERIYKGHCCIYSKIGEK